MKLLLVCKYHVCCVNLPHQVKEAAKVLGVGAPVLQADPLLMQENKKRDLNKRIPESDPLLLNEKDFKKRIEDPLQKIKRPTLGSNTHEQVSILRNVKDLAGVKSANKDLGTTHPARNPERKLIVGNQRHLRQQQQQEPIFSANLEGGSLPKSSSSTSVKSPPLRKAKETQRSAPEVSETRKKTLPLSLQSKRIKEEPGLVVDNSRFKRQIRKVLQAGKSSSISKSLARKAGKAKLVVKQEKLVVGYDQAEESKLARSLKSKKQATFRKAKQSHRDQQNQALKRNKPKVNVKAEKLLDGDDEELSIEYEEREESGFQHHQHHQHQQYHQHQQHQQHHQHHQHHHHHQHHQHQ